MATFQKNSTAGALRAAGALSTVGLSFVVALVIGFFAGKKLDEWWHTSPLFTFTGFLLGVAAGILNVFRAVARAFPPSSAPPASQAPPPDDRDERGNLSPR